MRPVNLARRPFRTERLYNTLFVLGVVALVALTVKHVFVVRRLAPQRTSALNAEVSALEAEAARLRAEQARMRGINPDPRALARWTVVKDLVDRRAFSWIGLFARLEERLPPGARLVSIAPTVQKGDIILDVQAVMRSPEVGWEFMRALEDGGDFDSVFPLQEGENGEFRYTMRYRPRAVAPAPGAPAEAAKGAPAEADPAAASAATTMAGPEPAPASQPAAPVLQRSPAAQRNPAAHAGPPTRSDTPGASAAPAAGAVAHRPVPEAVP